MPTALVNVFNSKRKSTKVRILLDTCSTANFITESLARSLSWPMQKCRIPIDALDSLTTFTKHLVSIKIQSLHNDFEKKLQFLTVPRIADLIPNERFPREKFEFPRNLKFADPEFHKPAKIDLLLGSGPTFSLLSIGQLNFSQHEFDLIVQKTLLGWVVGGTYSPNRLSKLSCNTLNTAVTPIIECDSLNQALAKFWEIEDAEVTENSNSLSPAEQECENHFISHTTRDSTGRFIVALPFKQNRPQLGNSFACALRQLRSLKQRFQNDSKLRTEYTACIQELVDAKHLVPVPDSQNYNEEFYYLPHHSVIKESSNTTKMRIVFNASAKTTSGLSFNDIVHVGPTIQTSTFNLHIKFRLHEVVLTGDIEKMYRMVKVRPEDQRYQRILWYQENEIIKLQSTVVMFGQACAPFLAIRTMNELCEIEKDNFPIASNIVKRDCYVDNVATGFSTVDQAIQVRRELSQMLLKGGFKIRQWASNKERVLTGLDPSEIDSKLDLNKDEPIKTLGVFWCAKNDNYTYQVTNVDNSKSITKRYILSEIAKIYDPLGLLGPVILYAKRIMQELWKSKLNWDESVTESLHTLWVEFCTQLNLLNQLSFERKILSADASKIQIHAFCDASLHGYGACIYVRSESTNEITCKLLTSKSRVAPIKQITIPRLELSGAKLLTNLLIEVMKDFPIKVDQVFCWTDSTIVIHWIRRQPHELQTFVSNRISFIQSNTKIDQWRHVRSKDNPADKLSRGQLPGEFLKNKIWKSGPTWLLQPENNWPLPVIEPIKNLPELKKINIFISSRNNEIFKRFSRYEKLLRVCSYLYRMGNSKKFRGPITVDELKETEMKIIKNVQSIYLEDEIARIRGKGHTKKLKFTKLDPFLDEKGILRVGGRLTNSPLNFDQKHPVLLPKCHIITDLIIRSYHVKNYHAGIQTTLYATRQKFWIPDGKNQIRNIINKCVSCFRVNPLFTEYKMGNLPSVRTTQARPFLNVGIDYCGPFQIKEKKFRNRTFIKVYVAVFVCMVVKAVHLELVTELSTESFLGALRRFLSRRGLPENIYSDNGSNFIGANKELKELYEFVKTENHQSSIRDYLNSQNVKWHFIPPKSPNFGGLWESNVKVFKHHFKRVTQNVSFTYEEFNTLIIEIEAIMNSRPLTPLSNDPNDLQALTPGHFLIGESLKGLPECKFESTPSNRLSVWQHLTKLKQDFWSRWHLEYLNELNIRHKWLSSSKSENKFNIGTMVILKDPSLPPMRWSLGRITENFPGADKVVRAVTVKTASGSYKRNVKDLAILPIDDNESASTR